MKYPRDSEQLLPLLSTTVYLRLLFNGRSAVGAPSSSTTIPELRVVIIASS
ncbi:MAG: hypothetical protein JO217_01830 [Acidobacteriaceae bacterium]|nr:hypothetical protein [Acidobacteriaceae bacterium]